MNLTSLGYRTDLIFHSFEGEITDRGRYLVILTPSNPRYRWGNFLIFDAPPRPGEYAAWTRLFAREVGTPPRISHKLFAWNTVNGDNGAVSDFLRAGFELGEKVVMAATTLVAPRRYNHEIEIRELKTDADFAEQVERHVLCHLVKDDEASYRAFFEASTESYRKMVHAGLGHWFGAFLDGRLVADIGIFTNGELGRYQSVVTHPDFRRRGIWGTLLYEVGRFGLETLGAHTLVIVADAHDFAKKIYAAVGFGAREQQGSLEWLDETK